MLYLGTVQEGGRRISRQRVWWSACRPFLPLLCPPLFTRSPLERFSPESHTSASLHRERVPRESALFSRFHGTKDARHSIVPLGETSFPGSWALLFSRTSPLVKMRATRAVAKKSASKALFHSRTPGKRPGKSASFLPFPAPRPRAPRVSLGWLCPQTLYGHALCGQRTAIVGRRSRWQKDRKVAAPKQRGSLCLYRLGVNRIRVRRFFLTQVLPVAN